MRDRLPDALQALCEAVMALPDSERRQVMHTLDGEISRLNDRRHEEAFHRAEQQRRRPLVGVQPAPRPVRPVQPRVRQLELLEAS